MSHSEHVEGGERCDDPAVGDGSEVECERRIESRDRLGRSGELHREVAELPGPVESTEDVVQEPESGGDLAAIDAELAAADPSLSVDHDPAVGPVEADALLGDRQGSIGVVPQRPRTTESWHSG